MTDDTYIVTKRGLIETLSVLGVMANDMYGQPVANALFTLSVRHMFPHLQEIDDDSLCDEIENAVGEAVRDMELQALLMTEEQKTMIQKMVSDE